jgi:prepilin-type N-terminal cleavage/methylation domain-containing protein
MIINIVLKQNTQHFRQGFTLLEILIVVAVIGIISVIILSGTGNGRIEREIDAAGREVVAAFRESQQYALTGRQIVPNTDPCQFALTWNSGSGNFTATYYYKDSNEVCNQTSVINTYTLRGGVTFGNTGAVAFTVPHGKTTFGGTSVGAHLGKAGTVGVACVYKDGLMKNILGSTSCP